MADKRVLTILGTRPEAIKLAPVIRAIDASPGLESVVAVSGQHQAMLDQVLTLFGVTPACNFAVMSPGQSVPAMASKIMVAAAQAIEAARPDAVLVQGDTTTTFIGAFAAAMLHVPVVHLEAGLRSGNRELPFPEELNRRLVAPLASLHLAATERNRQALLAEGIPARDIQVIGNTVIDALLWVVDQDLGWEDTTLTEAEQADSFRPDADLVVVTAHRRESWGTPIRELARAVADVARTFPQVGFVWPLHANPTVQSTVRPELEGLENVVVTGPLGYQDFSRLLAKATVAVTDSGGVQEEAPALGIPVLVTRDVTERIEVVEGGGARLVGCDREAVRHSLGQLLADPGARHEMTRCGSPYGDGRSAPRAAAAIGELVGVDVPVGASHR